jgi:hypothetical protein
MLYNVNVKAHSATEAVDAAYFHGITDVLDVSHIKHNEFVLIVDTDDESLITKWFAVDNFHDVSRSPFPFGAILFWSPRRVPPMAKASR